MNTDTTSVFTPHRLIEITGGDAELIGDMLVEFQRSLAIYAVTLAAARRRPDWRDAAHRLKGAAQAVGADAIASIAVLAELSAPGDRALLARLDVEVARFSEISLKVPPRRGGGGGSAQK